jgi:ketosteroid isomerase-like protein
LFLTQGVSYDDRRHDSEIAVYTVQGGKIVQERFFHDSVES